MKYITHILIAMVFLSACSNQLVSKKTSPLFGKEYSLAEYPQSKYMTATGIGKTEIEAQRYAKAEMSNIFESKVSSSTMSRITAITDEEGSELVSRDAEQKIRVISAVDLKGLEIGKTWKDDSKGLYFAIAILDRGKARKLWQHEIDAIDSQIEADLESLSLMKSDFSRFQSLKKMRGLWLNREVILSRLQVLGFSVTNNTSYDIKEILKNINKIKSSIIIFIDLRGSKYSKELSGLISENLTGSGYVVGKTPDHADIVIKGSLRTEEVELNNPNWEFARATVSLVILDNKSGLKVGEIVENRRASHLTLSEASHKASTKLSKLITEKLADYFGDGR